MWGRGDQLTSKLLGSISLDASSKKNSLGLLLLKHFEHLHERERAANIGIQDEDAFRVSLKDSITEVVETSGGTEGGVFTEVADLEAGELGGPLPDRSGEDSLVVVSDKDNLLDRGDLGDGAERVPDQGVAGDFKEGLGAGLDSCTFSDVGGIEFRRCAESSRTLGRSRERGRKRVPREGPPT
jgi:hypothetical protein